MRLRNARAATGREQQGSLLRRRTVHTAFSLIAPLAAALLLVSAASAQGTEPLTEPRYTVEMIVFAYRGVDSGSNEIFVPDKPKLIPDAEEELPADVSQNVFSDIPEPPPNGFPEAGAPAPEGVPDQRAVERERIELHVLEPDAYTMDEVYRKLERLDAYQPIMRAAWTQTTPPKETSPAVHLRALGNPPPGLDGSVTLYRGRYLHLVVDLALNADSSDARDLTATDRLIVYGDDRARRADSSEPSDVMRQPVRYRIFEDRIMKTGDLRYFDHPRFGVVARVTRPQESPASASAGADLSD